MSTHGREATDDYSNETGASTPRRTGSPRLSGALATGAAGLGIAGAILAFVATFSTVIQIRVLTVTTARFDGMDRWGPALLVLGVFALLMVAGAWRGARPAMGALALAGVAILLIAILRDVPHLDDKGVWPLADQYEDAQASAGRGFYFETAAGVLMLLGGALLLMLTSGRAASERPRAGRSEPRRRPSPADRPGRTPDDWFAEPPADA